jgi:phage FluMu protein Com
MIDVKCKNCNRLLAKAESMNAAIKCPRCKMIFEYKLYSNLFLTTEYNSSLQNKHNRSIMQTESTETMLE